MGILWLRTGVLAVSLAQLAVQMKGGEDWMFRVRLANDTVMTSLDSSPSAEDVLFARLALSAVLTTLRSHPQRPISVFLTPPDTLIPFADAARHLAAIDKPVICTVQHEGVEPLIVCHVAGTGSRLATHVEAKAAWTLSVLSKLGATDSNALIEIRTAGMSTMMARASLERWLHEYYISAAHFAFVPGGSSPSEEVIATMVVESPSGLGKGPSDSQRAY
jgi:hypothetical protein